MAKKDFLFDPNRNPLYRDDYRPLDYRIATADLHFNLDPDHTRVTNTITVSKNADNAQAGGPLVLDGENLTLVSLQIVDAQGVARDLDRAEYIVTDKNLILKTPPSGDFTLKIVTDIAPAQNTALSGLYTAGDILTTQCEAQGFRRISYFLDRPDNMAVFTSTLEADQKTYPVLLSNGNGDYKQSTDLGNGRHAVTWTDPWPKPSYLFAAVAGDMHVLEDSFTTMSGKNVALRIFVQDGYQEKIDWAMELIKRAMKWDEQKYGLEYDLDCFHIVAVDKFNAGAMENKGLNIFNAKCLVGSPEFSTDEELIYIERVIAHEYFHNYSGDRVTVRDWFELTLKEGLTVLRDRQFTADMHSKGIKQLQDAILLRSFQFPEDTGPTAHAIRPDRVEEFDNIYTQTIYQKGSHVLGMLHTMMGEKTWRAATDEYFSRFDNQAVTCDDFVDVMQEVSGLDLAQFRRWYSQSGTPEVSYQGHYDAKTRSYVLTLTQKTPPTADQAIKQPLHMPIAVGLIGESGKDVALNDKGETTRILHLTEATQSFVFSNVNGPVVPSVLRGFSAPVRIVTEPSNDELLFRMMHDSDGYNRYEATERFTIRTLLGMIEQIAAGKKPVVPQSFIDAYALNLSRADEGDLAFNAQLLDLPSQNLITPYLRIINPDHIGLAQTVLKNTLAEKFRHEFLKIHRETRTPQGETCQVVPAQTGRRALHNLALEFVSAGPSPLIAPAADQFKLSTNMTEKLQALSILTRMGIEDLAKQALADFYKTYKSDNNLMDKWLNLNAGMASKDPVAHMRALMTHEAYDATNPNKVRALFGGFINNNNKAFHAADGSGYQLLADAIIEMNAINGKTGTGLARHFAGVRRYDADRQTLMLAQMKRVMAVPTLDTGTREILGKAIDSVTVKKPGNDNKRGFLDFGRSAKKK